jgi:four helix bundle protein
MLAIARGEAEETISHLRLNVAAKRIAIADFWRLRNRLVTIVKMLNSLMRSG